jgi:hypothetical protein
MADPTSSDPDASEGAVVPLHRRTIEYEAFDAGESMVVVGRLHDSRPWAHDTGSITTVHDMELRVTVRIDDMSITEASAEMRTFPHVECPGIVESFASLVGLSVSRGYTRQVQDRFGGPRGCTHLEQLARSLGPVVVQAVTSRRALAVSRGESQDLLSGSGSPWARNSCHVWAEGGVADRKLAAGWRPGVGPYPAPTAETFEATGTAP